MLIKQKVVLIESNLVDISLFVFSIKDVCCKGVDNRVAKEVMSTFNFKCWCL